MENPIQEANLLLVGNNCGPAKLATQIDTGNIIIEEEAFFKIIEQEWKIEEYIRRFNFGLCPRCESSNTGLNPVNKKTFWGCIECNYGWWEKYLPDGSIKKFCENKGLTYQLQRYVDFLTKKKVVKKKPKTDGSKQLSLF